MKIWFLRGLVFVTTLFLGAVLIAWLNGFANSHWRPTLYDLNLLGFCPRNPNLLIACTLGSTINYLLIGIAFVSAIASAYFLVRKDKVYFIPITLLFIIVGFIIGRVVVENIISSIVHDAVVIPMKQRIN